MMKAIIHTKYGGPDVLRLMDVPKPSPKEDEVLVRVHAVSINKADRIVVRGKPFVVRLMASGLFRPAIDRVGSDLAGTVESVGPAVKRIKSGDKVFGCLRIAGRGSLAEYVCAPEAALALKPPNCTFEEAAAVPLAGMTALQGLKDKGAITPGMKVLICGASGGVGTFAVQIAKAYQTEVTALCSSRNVETAERLGADRVIDYSKDDFSLKDDKFDLILGVNGYHSILAYRKALAPSGTYVMAGGSGGQIAQALLLGRMLSRKGGKTMLVLSMRSNTQDLEVLAELLRTGKVRPLIERTFALEQTPDAFRYLDDGHAQGKVVIIVAEG